MLEGFSCGDSLGMVKLKHPIEQIVCVIIVNLADLAPVDLLFLHFLRDQAAVAQLECYLLDVVRAEKAHEGYQVGDREILYLGAVVQTEDWVPLGQEAQEDDSTGPNVDGAALVRVVEQSLGRHVALGACAILDLHLLLQVDDLLYCFVLG